MSATLRDGLRREAAEAQTYAVYERALATARRSRRRTAVVTVAILGVLALLLPAAPSSTRQLTGAAVGRAALPDRIGLPPWGALRLTDSPHLGSAAVVFTGTGSRFGGWSDDPDEWVVTEAGSDRYRLVRVGPIGDDGVLLSPDGRTIAVAATSANGVAGVDLITMADGSVRHLDLGAAGGGPIGWSPDGDAIVVGTAQPDNSVQLALRAIASGTRTALGPADPDTAVAFSPDGGRIAYELHREVHVVSADGRELHRFGLPAGTRVAGRGAWSPDGARLALVPREPAYDWAMRFVDPATGATATGPVLPRITTTADRPARLLGWQPDGTALVRRGTQILALSPGAAIQRTVLTAPVEVTGLDVAAGVITGGQTWHANPPWPFGPRFWVGFLMAGLALVAAWLGWRWYRRRTRRRRVTAIPWQTAQGPLP